ncbi:MAG TPA: DJ-1/PfpI family protein [Terracidiphilus sp.]|nr:DJ-1/PfpI family protein [Terracidiphilus sp.]
MSRHHVHLFVFDTMADWEPAFAVAGINNPQFQKQPGRFRVITVAESQKLVTTIGGLRIVPDMVLAELDPDASSLLILPGGQRWESGGSAAAIEKARLFLEAGVPVAAICAATLALARAGLLDGRRHTSNAREYIARSGYRGGRFYCDAPAVRDSNLITASGISPIDFAREIFSILNLYDPAALDAWYALFKHADASKNFELASGAAH